jgi:hypothetical protein
VEHIPTTGKKAYRFFTYSCFLLQNQEYSIEDVEMCAYQPIFSLLPIDLTT